MTNKVICQLTQGAGTNKSNILPRVPWASEAWGISKRSAWTSGMAELTDLLREVRLVG
jgi:hypothetical protein